MPDQSFPPLTAPFDLKFRPPGSKSLTNRALVLAALADGQSVLSNILLADDTSVMLDGLERLGLSFDIDMDPPVVRINGRGGSIPAAGAELFCGNSGTTIRFLTAVCALGRGEFRLDGVARMRQRPIGPLLDMLKNLGVRADCPDTPGYPPVHISADGLPGGYVRLAPGLSSQFLSAVLMVSPYARHELQVDLAGRQASWPYVVMTMRLMDIFANTPHLVRDPATDEPRQIIVPTGSYAATNYDVEPDASSAGYFLAAAALHPGSRITIDGLGRDSLQGDVGLARLLADMGAEVSLDAQSITVRGGPALHCIDADLLDMPDTAQTLAVLALFARGRSTLRGLRTLRVKETDRLAALATELSKLGAEVTVHDDTLTINPPSHVRAAAVDTYDDHRMAMSFALAATRSPGITIRDAQCVSKTYPGFFSDLQRLR